MAVESFKTKIFSDPVSLNRFVTSDTDCISVINVVSDNNGQYILFYHTAGGTGDRNAIKSDGSIVTHIAANHGCTLASATTYYFALGSISTLAPAQTPLVSVHLKWAAAVAAVFTVETCNFPELNVGDDVSNYSSTAGDWIPEDPTGAEVEYVGSGNSASGLVVTAGGSAIGGCMIHLGNLGSKRVRIKAVVTTGGVVRCNVAGKAGG